VDEGTILAGHFQATRLRFTASKGLALAAGGTLGGGQNPSFYSVATAKDPDYIDAGQLTPDPNGNADVYVPIELTSATLFPTSGFSAHVDITTASATYNLFDLSISGATDQAVITTPTANVSYFLHSLAAGPPTDTSTQVSLSSLESTITSDIVGGQLNSPIDIGLVLSDLPVPTALYPNPDDSNAVAAINVDETVYDAESAVPEPGTLSMLAVCGALLGKRRQHCKARSY
jgi:hypothetical protein